MLIVQSIMYLELSYDHKLRSIVITITTSVAKTVGIKPSAKGFICMISFKPVTTLQGRPNYYRWEN